MDNFNQQEISNTRESPRTSRDFAVRNYSINELQQYEDPPKYSLSIAHVLRKLKAAFTRDVQTTEEKISSAIDCTLTSNNDIDAYKKILPHVNKMKRWMKQNLSSLSDIGMSNDDYKSLKGKVRQEMRTIGQYEFSILAAKYPQERANLRKQQESAIKKYKGYSRELLAVVLKVYQKVNDLPERPHPEMPPPGYDMLDSPPPPYDEPSLHGEANPNS